MLKSSKKLISLILTFTLMCTLFVGLGAVESFATEGEGAQLVTETVHFNYNEHATDKLAVYNTALYVTGEGTNLALNNLNSNTDLHFVHNDGQNNHDDKVIKLQYLSSAQNKYIESYASQKKWNDNVLTGNDIFEFTGDIYLGQSVTSTTSATNWCCYAGDTSARTGVMFNKEFTQLAAQTWYSFKFKIDLGNDIASLRFTNLDNVSSDDIYGEYKNFAYKNFYSIKINPLTTEGSYLYFDNIKTARYSTTPGKKAVITSVGTNDAVAPVNKVNFKLDKAIAGLDKSHISVTGGGLTEAITATGITNETDSSITATLSSSLEALKNDYTLNISGSVYGNTLLEVQGDNYVPVTDITKTFATTDNVFTEETTQDEIEEAMTWSAITDADAEALTLETKLPTTYRGADISWTSEPAGYISEDGQIIKNDKGTDRVVTLTAAVSVGDTTIGTVSYGAVILGEELKTIIVNRSYIQGVKSTEPDKISAYSLTNKDDAFKATHYANSFQFDLCAVGVNGEVDPDDSNTNNGDALAFMQFDLSAHKKIVDAATSVKMVIPMQQASDYHQGNTIVATLLNDSSDDWDDTDLTYNKAINSGMYGDPGLFTKTGIKAEARNDVILPDKSVAIVIEDAELTPALKDALMQNPDEGKVSFRFHESNGWACKFQSGNWSPNEGPELCYLARLEISYYESDIKADSEFANTITWDAISTQDQDNVVADLTLPTSWFGQTVTWDTTNNAVISNTGVVTIPEIATDVTLTATINGVATPFVITVPAMNIAVKSNKIYEKDIAIEVEGMDPVTGKNCSTGYIYANEAVNTTCTAIIATYNANGELAGITVKDNVTISEGKNIITPTGWHNAFAGATTKLILVEDMTSLKPLAVAK